LPPSRNRYTCESPRRAPAASTHATGALLAAQSMRSQQLFGGAPHNLTDLDRHAAARTALAWRHRCARRELACLLRVLDVDDPIASEKLLRLGKDAVCDRRAIGCGANQLCLGGNASPSVATRTPSSRSCLLKSCMKAKFACRSFFGHLA